MEKSREALGIPDTGFTYMKFLPEQSDLGSKINEFIEIGRFLEKVVNSNTIPEFQGKDKSLQFINYGETQLVYVLSVGKRKYTLLLGQPATEFGVVKKEYENLRWLGKKNKQNVVIPIQYFSDEKGKHELYVTPYSYQARCIGVDTSEWGVWIPEPEYYFKEFSPQQKMIVNSSMIAILIKMFDAEKNLGIGACKLSGGDFMLEKGYENQEMTYENVLKNIKLIAARELITISLEEYISRLREEFSRKTYYKTEAERDKSILINYKSRAPMSAEEIERGITLGCKLRERETQIQK